jgi:hypothetical protein
MASEVGPAPRLDGLLEISVGGTAAVGTALTVQGAYRQDKSLHHFESAVSGGKASVQVPGDARRLEYALTDAGGGVYDFQQENRFNDSGLGMNRLVAIAAL